MLEEKRRRGFCTEKEERKQKQTARDQSGVSLISEGMMTVPRIMNDSSFLTRLALCNCSLCEDHDSIVQKSDQEEEKKKKKKKRQTVTLYLSIKPWNVSPGWISCVLRAKSVV